MAAQGRTLAFLPVSWARVANKCSSRRAPHAHGERSFIESVTPQHSTLTAPARAYVTDPSVNKQQINTEPVAGTVQ
ncbi:hypothetical protein E2C01_096465 [Portunus trituberculatus]|uniref:Uncharacterized protein n=1 Tax=Portunus trituberculatus TaxID=210409 RepID=A0A5B7K6W8_PORTR|nr:hypothetical protein [Portunus trituberculatus]